jgi:kynurenine formamidase
MARRIVDLSVTLTNNMPAHKFFPRPVIVPHFTHDDMESWGNGTPDDNFGGCTTFIAMTDHVGTHVDAFVHMKRGGASIDQMPLDMFVGKAACLDLRHIPDLGDMDTKDFEIAERKAGVKIDGHIVLICTGFHKRHFPSDKAVWSNPGITAEATHWLADRSRVHGVEGPSTDKPSHNLFPSHRVCRDRGITHYEWLCNLEELLGKGEFEFTGLPLRIGNGSGSPVRAVAFLE